MKNNKEYLDKVSKIIEPPYFKELEYYGITDFEEQLYILKSKLPHMNSIQQLPSKIKYIRDIMGNLLYSEKSNGSWKQWEFHPIFGNIIDYQESPLQSIKNIKWGS